MKYCFVRQLRFLVVANKGSLFRIGMDPWSKTSRPISSGLRILSISLLDTWINESMGCIHLSGNHWFRNWYLCHGVGNMLYIYMTYNAVLFSLLVLVFVLLLYEEINRLYNQQRIINSFERSSNDTNNEQSYLIHLSSKQSMEYRDIGASGTDGYVSCIMTANVLLIFISLHTWKYMEAFEWSDIWNLTVPFCSCTYMCTSCDVFLTYI